MKILIPCVVIILAQITYSELRHQFSINAETAVAYDGNILYPDSITETASLLSTTSIRPSLLLQPDNASMFRLSTTLQHSEQFSVSDRIFYSNFQLLYKKFISHKSMIGASASGFLTFSDNELLRERFLTAELSGGRYLTPFVNLTGRLGSALRNFPGLFKVYEGEQSLFYDHFEIRPQLTLTLEHSPRLANRVEISAMHRYYYDDIHPYEFIDYIITDSIDHIVLNSGGGFDTVYVVKAVPSINITRQRDFCFRALVTTDLALLESFNITISIEGILQESNDSYYISREIVPTLVTEYKSGSNRVILTLSWPSTYFPERENGSHETSPFAGLILGRKFSRSWSTECSIAYRQVNNTDNNLDYSKPVAALKVLWKY